MYVIEPGKTEVIKHIQAASTVGMLCTSQEALRHSIYALRACLDTYDLEVWSILHERDTCAASVKELKEVLAAEESTDEEVEMRKEKARYDAKRVMTVREKVVEEEDEGKGEAESDDEGDEPIRGPGLSVKAQGKHPAK